MKTKCIDPRPAECCGCGACKAVCPVNAIKMQEDRYGFVMPAVDKSLCIGCGKCSRVCAFASAEKYKSSDLPVKAYAAAVKDEALLKGSASGGVFAGAASRIIDEGGVVFGAAMDRKFNVRHIGIRSKDKLHFLQGSKYTQSDASEVYAQVKSCLSSGRKVLFSGTPCQAAALKAFLGGDHDGLYTIDLICHGVGNNRMFRDDVKYLSGRYGSEIRRVSFRSKRNGWGSSGDIVLDNKVIGFSPANSPYYYFYYIDSSIMRESCYNCPFAAEKRVGDITIGDFWRIGTLFPTLDADSKKGISCIIVNTPKGQELTELLRNDMKYYETSPDEVVRRNGNLRSPSRPAANRETILKLYSEGGYDAVSRFYLSSARLQRVKLRVKSMIPRGIRSAIRKRIAR